MSAVTKSIVFKLLLGTLCVALAGCAPHENTKSKVEPAESDVVTLSPKALERFGIHLITVADKVDDQQIITTGEIKADDNLVFHINSLSNGRVVSDKAMLGDIIQPGQILAVVQNLDVTRVYGEYIHQAHQNEIDIRLAQTRASLAKKDYDRIKSLHSEGIAAQKDLIKAEADNEIAEETLRGLQEHARHIRGEAQAMLSAYGVKINDSHSERIENNSPIVTPRGGIIMKKTVTVGDVVSNTEPLYVVGDLSHVWLDIAIYDKQLQSVKVGDAVSFMTDSIPGRSMSGRIDYIKPSVEENSSTFVARAVLDNPRLELKPGMVGQVTIRNQHASSAPFIPEQSLQHLGNESFVFLVEPNGSFKKQLVEPGKKVAGGYLVYEGLHVGQRIVGEGSFTIKAEMLKSKMSGEE